MTIKDLHGRVERCICTNWNPDMPMTCQWCFSRGYVAECLACSGAGMKEEPVAGSNGTMKSTCASCGGKGKFGVNKPADWDITHPEQQQEALDAAADIPEPTVGAGVDKVYPDAQSALKDGDKGWVTPPPSPGHVHNSPVGAPITSVLA